jgi:hypothetical protein
MLGFQVLATLCVLWLMMGEGAYVNEYVEGRIRRGLTAPSRMEHCLLFALSALVPALAALAVIWWPR